LLVKIEGAFVQLNHQIDRLLNESHSTLLTHVDYLSHHFLTMPYLEAPLDEDRLFRFDAFDCLTYVNTVLALLFSNNWVEFKRHIVRLNYYNSIVSYEKRFHFMCVDWNSQNSANNYISDITRFIVDKNNARICEYAYALINKPAWFKNKLGIIPENCRKAHACTPYIPLPFLFKKNILNQLPAISIVEIVRPNWDLRQQIGTQLNISHLGFLLRINGKFIFRHASQIEQCVIEHPFLDYLTNYINSSTVKGINIQKILSLNRINGA
jgi:hypothetical protein